jgi:quercetin dioxygenase-like cupin family protein
MNCEQVRSQLPEWALGMLGGDVAVEIERHCATCAPCAREADAWQAPASALSSLLVAPGTRAPASPAPPFLRARVLASAFGVGALAEHAEAVARLFEISVERARRLLDAVAVDEAWEPHPAGIELVHVAAGPRFARGGFDTGLVRFPAGIAWPLHRHLGEERHLFLEGGIRLDDTGQVFGPGDVLVSAAGTEHAFHVLPDRPCVTAVVLETGIEMPPGHPVSF